MSTEQQTIALDDPAYNRAVKLITVATMAATEDAGGDPQPAFRALVFVLLMYLDADKGLATNKAIRERGEEVGRVVTGQVRWMREERETSGEPMMHTIMREMAGRAVASTIN